MAFVVGEGSDVIAGDLDGVRGARSILGTPDEAAWQRSVAALRSVAPDARWLPGHGAVGRPALTGGEPHPEAVGMDAEPRGHTIDGTPWEEPRPPHLPDRLTSISPWVLPFLVVVVFQLWLFWLDQPFGTDPRSPLEYWLDTRYQFAEIAGSLIGLALFLRHPDARTDAAAGRVRGRSSSCWRR